jgi:hypothetical protein
MERNYSFLPSLFVAALAPTEWPNKSPAPNRRLRFPLGALRDFVYLFRAPPASPAAVGEARRSAKT